MRPLVAASALAMVSGPALGQQVPGDVADLHVDLPYQVHYLERPADLGRPAGQVDAASLRAGRLRLIVLSLFMPNDVPGQARRARRRKTLAELLAVTDTADRIVRSNPDLFGAGRIRAVYSVEGSDALADHLDRIPELVRRGVVLFGPVHSSHNELADSATDPRPGRGGLTALGERFIRAVYAAGALVDVSHSSDSAFDDIARIASDLQRPLVATHSNARALADHPRNLTDDQLRAIAASGGLVGLNFHIPFLRRDGAATIADVVGHAMHMRRVMGPGHLAIGSDLDGDIRPARGLETHAGLGDLARALDAAGIRGPELADLLGASAARLLAVHR
ncbi:MAG: membrane dipeptidase [Deltaproteobacteria bacterium]|nr:membrane dipeptidase [Deltaproteobacteria bacterium]